ncbi:hypothetical protein RN001_005242 [Aquatica leii]|uniref:Uncharacterized protein n=1 Tax=Aquatica leii TaxID=1421715 RepID=A0AAN7SPT2_9COLE|nr:hypothetical protein RN001_005242 [Aquatica leii]
MTETSDKKQSNVFLGLYLTFSVLFIIWVTSKFFRGRRQFHVAVNSIEEQLLKLQQQLDDRCASDMIEPPLEDEDANHKEQFELSIVDSKNTIPSIDYLVEFVQKQCIALENLNSAINNKFNKKGLILNSKPNSSSFALVMNSDSQCVNCKGNGSLAILDEEKLRNRYLCDLHFNNDHGFKSPHRLTSDAVSKRYNDDEIHVLIPSKTYSRNKTCSNDKSQEQDQSLTTSPKSREQTTYNQKQTLICKMEKTDKAVSTEDLYTKPQRAIYLEVAKLESVFRTLVENKVQAIKNDKVRLASANSSPKNLVRRMRITSSSSASSSKVNIHKHSPSPKHRRRRKATDEEPLSCEFKKPRTEDNYKTDVQNTLYSKHRCCLRSYTDEETREIIKYLHCDSICSADDYISISPVPYPCCSTERSTQMVMPCSSDYVSLKMDGFEELEDESVAYRNYINREKRKRHRRKRRRRRRHLKSHIEITSLPISEEVKDIDPDELPQRARWTIVITACLLLFMCLLLVGITLRMAPIIDDMVRKENEEFMNSLHREPGHHVSHNLSPPNDKE